MKKIWLFIIFINIFSVIMAEVDGEKMQILEIDGDISFFEIGKNISYLGINNDGPRILINSSTFLPFFYIRSDGITFTVAFRNNVIRAIFVGDFRHLSSELFRTPEGIFIGMSYREVRELIPDIELIEIPGFAYEGILLSGWKIGFVTGSHTTDYFPNPDDKIEMIYKN